MPQLVRGRYARGRQRRPSGKRVDGLRNGTMVYDWCMSRTNIDIDEKAVAAVMRRYGFQTRREAVNYALRALATDPLPVAAARNLRGSGWSGDLNAMRSSRVP
jgi:Arc/MetJ family transcription regulator